MTKDGTYDIKNKRRGGYPIGDYTSVRLVSNLNK